MKIVDLQVIPFRVRRRHVQHGALLPEVEVIQTLTRVVTDGGAEGYYLGGVGTATRMGCSPTSRQWWSIGSSR